jgi:hypothetical protein
MRVRLPPLLRALVLSAAFVGTCGLFGRDAVAAEAPLSADERARLLAGDDVVRLETFDIDHERYVGGLVYVVIAAMTPNELVALLSDAAAMQQILPRTQYVKPAGVRGADTLLELHQGNALLHASYTLRVRSEPERNRVRFWLDRSRPHAIDDAWGFFRYEPFEGPAGPALLVTYGVLVDLGSGVFRSLYEERLRAMALTVPLRLREYVMRTARAPSPA